MFLSGSVVFIIVVSIIVGIAMFLVVYKGLFEDGEIKDIALGAFFIVVYLIGSIAFVYFQWSTDTSIREFNNRVEDMKNTEASIELYFDNKGEIVSNVSKRSNGDYLVETISGDYFVIDVLENGQVVEKNNVKRKED